MQDTGLGLLLLLVVIYYIFKVISNRKRMNMRIRPLGWNQVKESNISAFGWIIIVFNIFWVYRLLKGLYDLGLSGKPDGEIGLAGVLFIIIWLLISMAVNVVLYVLYRITAKKNRRICPACGITVAIGLTVCPKCSFDFAKAAGA
jgi:hypothetical protein